MGAYSFSVLHELEQIIRHPTRVPDRHEQAANTLDLFLTSNPHHYSHTVTSPLRSSDHCLVSVSTTLAPPSPLPTTKRRLWHFERAQRADLSAFLTDFPWVDVCFRSGCPDLAAVKVTEIMTAGMEAKIHPRKVCKKSTQIGPLSTLKVP